MSSPTNLWSLFLQTFSTSCSNMLRFVRLKMTIRPDSLTPENKILFVRNELQLKTETKTSKDINCKNFVSMSFELST